mmetsp:Transcript_9857/g.14672  ORF Transcript_9857/g.14672 Transcript_9857/m.14672 type:complete len:280 (+) Transcript_9857:270-1109(+)
MTGTTTMGFTANPFSIACAAASARRRTNTFSPCKLLPPPSSIICLRAVIPVSVMSITSLPTFTLLKSSNFCHKISTLPSSGDEAYTGRAPVLMVAISYVFKIAGNHLVATQSVKRFSEGTEANSVSNKMPVAEDESIARSTSADHSSSVNASPRKDVTKSLAASLLLLLSLQIPMAIKAAASPTARRDERAESFGPNLKAGSRRTDLKTYSSLRIGSRLGPPTKGGAPGTPNKSPCFSTSEFDPSASHKFAGQSTSLPNRPLRNAADEPSSFCFSSRSL